jgi:hypothetical protein
MPLAQYYQEPSSEHGDQQTLVASGHGLFDWQGQHAVVVVEWLLLDLLDLDRRR